MIGEQMIRFHEMPITEHYLASVRVIIEAPHMEHSATMMMKISELELLDIEPREKPPEDDRLAREEWVIYERQRAERESRMVDMISKKIAMALVRHIVNRDK